MCLKYSGRFYYLESKLLLLRLHLSARCFDQKKYPSRSPATVIVSFAQQQIDSLAPPTPPSPHLLLPLSPTLSSEEHWSIIARIGLFAIHKVLYKVATKRTQHTYCSQCTLEPADSGVGQHQRLPLPLSRHPSLLIQSRLRVTVVCLTSSSE